MSGPVPGLDEGKAVLKHEAADAGRFGLRRAGVEPRGLRGRTSGGFNWEDALRYFLLIRLDSFHAVLCDSRPGVTVWHVALELVARRLTKQGCKSRGFVKQEKTAGQIVFICISKSVHSHDKSRILTDRDPMTQGQIGQKAQRRT